MRPTPRPSYGPGDLGLDAVAIFAWGVSGIVMQYQVGVIEPEISVVWRFLLAAPMMFTVAVMRDECLRFPLRAQGTLS